MLAVEPYFGGSRFRSPLDDQKVRKMLKFSDAYDLDNWNTMSKQVNHSPLIPWEHFIETAPRNLITVSLKYPTKSVKVDEGKSYRQGCTDESQNKLVRFLESKNFTVVRRVCINHAYIKEINESLFYSEIFGENKSDNSTVLFFEWRGLTNNRMRIRNSGCERQAVNVDGVPSKQVYLDAQKYVETFLKTKNYVSILLRMEKAMEALEGKEIDCFHQTIDHWRKMVSVTGIKTTFLSADIGRLGSGSFRKKPKVDAFSKFISEIYGDQLTISQWEASFENISSSPERGYIAILQKTIATEAKCVLLVGGGNYQIHALKLYRQSHREEDWCVHIARNCTVKDLLSQS
jgi:hypothetical protein